MTPIYTDIYMNIFFYRPQMHSDLPSTPSFPHMTPRTRSLYAFGDNVSPSRMTDPLLQVCDSSKYIKGFT